MGDDPQGLRRWLGAPQLYLVEERPTEVTTRDGRQAEPELLTG
jgi:hypothetical protein